jgi:hypothetical protein
MRANPISTLRDWVWHTKLFTDGGNEQMRYNRERILEHKPHQYLPTTINTDVILRQKLGGALARNKWHQLNC